MPRFNRRRLPGRKLLRPGRPAAPPPPPPLDVPLDNPQNGDSTEFAIPSVGAAKSASGPYAQQDTTVELPALRPGADPDEEPQPPRRMEFTCACGAKLIATSETYDKHTRCAMCQTVLLVNLVYDPERGSHEIVPFRVNPDSPL